MNEREALKMALDFISRLKFADAEPEPDRVMAVLKEALANHCEDNLNMVKQEHGYKDGYEAGWTTALNEAYSNQAQRNVTKDEPDWKALVLNHNADCESRCDMDRCGYKPYFEYSKRRCPDCPVHEMIDVEYTTPQQRKPLTDDQIYEMYNEPRSDAEMLEFARAIEAAHGIKENT